MQFNWKKIRSVTPAGKTVAKDRAPTAEEVRAALKLASPRERAVMLVMASGGLRIGALPGLKLKDAEYLQSGLGRITVYAGEQEEYQTFVTPECVDAIKDYLASRERVGEKLASDSLLFRDKFDCQEDRRQKKVSPSVPHPVNEHAVRTTILRLWQRAGVRMVNDGRPFKSDHGLRKFAKTQMSKAGMKWEDSEVLLGHAFNYNKPSAEHLEEEYLKAVPFLSVDEKYVLKSELESQKEANESEWKRTRLELLEYKQAVSQLTTIVQEMKAERERELSRKGPG
ncbi:MAG: site-specific integrase [Nitrososphaerota archaeon]|nr:site-specific integrase [Nitrososphaerota archaeon]MDG6919394.1 site-specific integrase [Nitrososphaerota archaeon]